MASPSNGRTSASAGTSPPGRASLESAPSGRPSLGLGRARPGRMHVHRLVQLGPSGRRLRGPGALRSAVKSNINGVVSVLPPAEARDCPPPHLSTRAQLIPRPRFHLALISNAADSCNAGLCNLRRGRYQGPGVVKRGEAGEARRGGRRRKLEQETLATCRAQDEQLRVERTSLSQQLE